ncbi:MAG: stage II sporulation protein M [Algicola sp.]|nr:stage II sporulation protein M [Algicola sp.]
MKQQTFEQRYQDCWAQMDEALILAENKAVLSFKKPPLDPELPQLYRRICHHLSLAQERRYSSYLVGRLNNLVLRGHQQLYQRRSHFFSQLIKFVVYTFPHQVRQNAAYVWLATLLFYGPAILLFILVQLQPELIYSLFDHETVANFEKMYDPSAEHVGQDRDAQSDIQMFGHYIQNNITIGFQTFATGLFYGLGSIFYLVYNGLFLGAVASHLVTLGYQDTFFPFVIGHGSFELTAITIAGGAGLMLGHSLIAPGQKTRLGSLKTMSLKALDLLYGIILMLTIAAFFEAFWSSNSSLSLSVKYSVGTFLWLAVIAYFVFAGKTKGSR